MVHVYMAISIFLIVFFSVYVTGAMAHNDFTWFKRIFFTHSLAQKIKATDVSNIEKTNYGNFRIALETKKIKTEYNGGEFYVTCGDKTILTGAYAAQCFSIAAKKISHAEKIESQSLLEEVMKGEKKQ